MLATLLAAAAALVVAFPGGGGAAGPPIVPPPLPTPCAVQQSAGCLQTQPGIGVVTVAPAGAYVGDTVTVTVTSLLAACPTPADEDVIAGLPGQRCGGTPVWGFGGGFVDNLTSGTVSATQVGTCDGSTWSCSFRIDDVTFPSAPGNRDPLPAWVTFGLRLSVARYDASLPEDHRIRLEQFDIDTPVWVVRPPTTGSIEIVKETIPAVDAQAFAFTGLGDFSLDTDPGTQLPNRRTFSDLETGGRVIRELPTPGWQLVSIDCNDQTGKTVQLDTATVTVDLAAGDVVTCVFRNRKTLGSALVVNSTADTADETPGDGACDTGATISRNGTPEPACTLRAATQEASTGERITFDIPTGVEPRIETALELTTPVTIDGTTQPGTGRVMLSGGGTRERGLVVRSDDSTLRGLVVSGYTKAAVVLEGNGNALEAAFVGTDLTGSQSVGARDGILVTGDRNRIGGQHARGTCLGPCNVVVGDGVGIDVSGGNENQIVGNLVGLDLHRRPAGSLAVGIQVAGSSVVLGVEGEGARNSVRDNEITSYVDDVGLLVASEIAGVSGNVIGTRQGDFTSEAPKGRIGLELGGPPVGGQHAVSDNTIATWRFGVTISANAVLNRNVVEDDLGTMEAGIVVGGGSPFIGTSTIRPGSGTGIRVEGGNAVLKENSIFTMRALGIDLVQSGAPNGQVTPNDALPGDFDLGPNGLQNYPVLTGATLVDGGLRVTGTLDSALLDDYTVELFASSSCADALPGQPLPGPAFGPGERFLGSVQVSTVAGHASFEATVAAPAAPTDVITATATGRDGTSEFSQCLAVASDTRLLRPSVAGATVLDIASSDGLVGKVVEIGEGATAERNFGLRRGSLILARPTRFFHAAGEPVRAVAETLFVSVDRATITRSARLPDIALLSGVLGPVAGRAIACGEDVTLTLGGATVAQRVPGTRFVKQKGNRCVFVARTENGIGRLELDVARGTWNAQVIRRDLERLANPVRVGLAVGDDAGSEDLRFRETKAVWTYVR